MGKLLYILDGHSQIFRAYYAPGAKNRTVRGKPVGAVYIFTRMLLKLIREHHPDYLICALDPAGPTFRNDLYPEYKANRSAMPEDLKQQIPVILDIIRAFDIPMFQVQGLEADDVIGALAKQAEARDMDVRLVSRDKDLKQLLSPRVLLLNTDDDSLYGPEDLKADLGLEPARFIDLLALTGDTVDNIPGAKGIGPKTAAQLLAEYGTLEEVLSRADEIKQPKRRENLVAFRGQAKLSKDLVTIRTDADVIYDKEDARLHEPRREKLEPLLRELNFKSILKELGWEGEPEAAAPEPAPTRRAARGLFDEPTAPAEISPSDYTLVDTPEVLKKLASTLGKAKGFALHAVAEENGPLLGLAFAVKSNEGHDGYYAPFVAPAKDKALDAAAALDLLKPLLEDAGRGKIGHDLKRDMRLLLPFGVHLRGVASDTKLDAFLIDPTREDAKLASLAREFLDHDPVSWDTLFGDSKKRTPLAEAETPRVMAYAAEFADNALAVSEALRPLLEERGAIQLAQELEMPLIEVLAAMEFRGIRIDRPYLKELSRTMGEEIARLEAECHELAGREFTVNSPKQLGEVLFDELGLPEMGKTAKGTARSTDQFTLEKLAPLHPLPARVLEYRHLAKLKSTYVDALPELADAEDRVHTTYRQTVATGRLSSKDPNLQNIPVRTELGKKIRRSFIAAEGNKLISADYSQIELRVLAHISEDEALLDAFHRGADIHSAVAARVFGIPESEVTAKERNVAKTVNFGVLYGQSAFGLSQMLGISRAEAKQFIDNYFEGHPKVRELTDRVLEDCRREGFVTTLLGRRRDLPEINSRNAMQRSQAERQAFNTVLQGTAADLIKRAMLDAHRRIESERLPWKMLLQVHDELVFEAPAGRAGECAEFAKEVMSGALALRAPLVVDAGVGDNWLEAKG